MRSWKSADIYRPIGSRNVLLYDGPSRLNGARILIIGTAQNGNRKIGHMLQLWIIPAISPIAAVQSGADVAVCGDCVHRGDRHGGHRSLGGIEEDFRVTAKEIRDAIASTRAPVQAPIERQPARPVPAPAQRAVVAPSAGNGNGDLTRAAERKVLTVLAQYPQGRTIRQVAILAGYAMNGGGFRNAVGRLRSLEYLDGKAPQLFITPAGVAALGTWTPLPTGAALAQHWIGQLDRKAEREVLQALLDAYPKALTAEEIAAATPTGYEANGGGFRNALGKLKTLELVAADRGAYTASEELFS